MSFRQSLICIKQRLLKFESMTRTKQLPPRPPKMRAWNEAPEADPTKPKLEKRRLAGRMRRRIGTELSMFL